MKLGTIFALSFITALSGALMPGPLLTVTIAQTAANGFRACVMLILGHSLLELLLVIGLVLGLGRILRIRPVIGTITVLGGAMLLWMGWGMLPGAVELQTRASAGVAHGTCILSHPLITGMAVSISNPYWVIWWATVGLTLFATLSQNVTSPRKAPLVIGSFYFGHIMGDIMWYLAVGAAVATGRSFINPAAYKIVVQVCGGFLIFLGGSFLYLVASGKLWSIKMNIDWARKSSGS